MAATSACPTPHLSVSPRSAAPGDVVTLTGTGWAKCTGDKAEPDTAALYLFYGTDTVVPFGPAQVRGNLRFTLRYAVPELTPGPARFEAQGTSAHAAAAFTVSPSTLPKTGGSHGEATMAVLALSAGLIIARAGSSGRANAS